MPKKGFKGPRLILPCQFCGKEIEVPEYKLKHGQGKFCSISCKSKANVHKVHALRTPQWDEDFQKRTAAWHQRMRDNPSDLYNWKGDDVGYSALHSWVRRHFGSPVGCEVCGLNDPNRKYHWANLTGEYTRERSDYKRMCVSCHSKFDRRPNRSVSKYDWRKMA